jgi:hypothetical protein
MNESINNTISYFAPKNRVYCSIRSLQNRVAIAVSVLSLGFVEYFQRLFKALGIHMTPNIVHFLKLKERQQKYRIEKLKKTETKRQQNKSKFERLKDLETKAKRARDKGDGVYKTGINMETGAPDDSKRRKTTTKKKVCLLIKYCSNRTYLEEICTTGEISY